jgi:hypothetical protein
MAIKGNRPIRPNGPTRANSRNSALPPAPIEGAVTKSSCAARTGGPASSAFAVARRTREIGIRIALGANSRRVLRTVFARAARQLGGGIVAGNSIILLIAWRTDALTQDLVLALTIMSVIMAVVGVLACAAPARRALRVQPTEALRQS